MCTTARNSNKQENLAGTFLSREAVTLSGWLEWSILSSSSCRMFLGERPVCVCSSACVFSMCVCICVLQQALTLPTSFLPPGGLRATASMLGTDLSDTTPRGQGACS